MIRAVRVYSQRLPSRGKRFLVDRIWPRGVSRDSLRLAGWAKEAAPSDALRVWFAHDPERWDVFRHRYAAELDAHPETWAALLQAARRGDVILLYGARDEEHNNAVALQAYLEARLRSTRA